MVVKRYLEEAAGDSGIMDYGGVARTPVQRHARIPLRVGQRNPPGTRYRGKLTLKPKSSLPLSMTVEAAYAAVNVVSREKCMLWV